MTSRRNVTWLLVFSLVVFAVAGWFVFPLGGHAVAETKTPVESALAVNVQKVRVVEQITRDRLYTGELRAARKSKLSFEISGRLIETLVDEGDAVTEGQLLAKVDVERTQARLLSSQAALMQANAVLAELVAGPREETIASAKADVASLDSDVARLDLDFQRSKKLLSTKSTSQERFDSVRFQLQAMTAKREAGQKKLDELMVGTRVEQLNAQKATVARLEAETEALRLEVGDGQLLAPFSGRISARYLDEGTVVSPGTAALEIIEDQKLEAWIGIPPASAQKLEPGSKYLARIDDFEFEMTLRTVRPTLDSLTLTQNAVFDLGKDVAQGKLVDGQIIRLVVPQKIKTRGIVLPTAALVPGPRGLWSTFVAVGESQNGYRVEQRDVTLLDAMGDQTLVTGTLQSGDAVIVEGGHRVVAGQRISIVEKKGALRSASN